MHFTTHVLNLSCYKSGCCKLPKYWRASDWIKLCGSHAIHWSYVLCCKASLLWAGKMGNVQILPQKVGLFYTFCNKFFQPATIWIVAWQVWTWLVKQATSLFNWFCSNAAKQNESFFYCRPWARLALEPSFENSYFSWPCRLRFSLKKKKVGHGVWILRASSPKSATVLGKYAMPVAACWWLISMGPTVSSSWNWPSERGVGFEDARYGPALAKAFAFKWL